MNLPFVLDIGIGLIFIYLTLSLLASELQELLTTLLQWRAQHLKQAIETLLAGESKLQTGQTSAETQAIDDQILRSKELAVSLYNHPLIRSLNQESKGILGSIAQGISQLTRATKTFSGKASGPSYLPSETFSTTLLETLRAGDLFQTLSELKLSKFVSEKLLNPVFDIVSDLRNSKANESLLERETQKFEAEITAIMQSFSRRETTLSNGFSQITTAVNRLRSSAEAVLPENDALSAVFLKRLAAIEQDVPSQLRESGPSIIEVVSELNNMAWVAQSLQKANGDYRTVVARLPDATLRQRFQAGYDLLQTMNQAVKESSQGRENFQAILTKVSPNLRDSLDMLAKRAQSKVETVEQGAAQLQKEVALWFDRSMERSTGVYKRNAKGVAIVIGFLLAVTTNTDTLHVVNRLAKDPTLRAAYTQVANKVVENNPDALVCLQSQQGKAAQAKCLPDNTAILQDAINSSTDLPIGWNETNWHDQWQTATPGPVVSGLKVLGGWFVSAIAISMGAPFWFNMLNKVINVRNSGRPPAPANEEKT